jgi:hypothetical protein
MVKSETAFQKTLRSQRGLWEREEKLEPKSHPPLPPFEGGNGFNQNIANIISLNYFFIYINLQYEEINTFRD